jgi:hypothetical protein
MRNAPVDERGRFVIDGLVAGLWELTVHVPGALKEPKRVKQQISLSDGVTTDVSITIDMATPNAP